MIAYFLKVVGWWLLTIVKFLFVPFGMLLKPQVGEEWSLVEVIIITSSGAALGVFIFYHFGEIIAKRFSAKRKIFNRRNRWFIRVKQRWGFKGLMLIAGLISVPIASMLAAKLYRHNPNVLPKLIAAFFIWSIALSTLAYGMKKIGLSF
jgi:hypothetical protein